jgi:hypothetical protein
MKRRKLTRRMKEELSRLAAMEDPEINTTEIPETAPDGWQGAERGRFKQ